uniref:Uncharacterized protein n=1 Tax=Anguilla anguilla TaxID=7936 RepID=A0A0E9XST3_ANGAN
MQAAAPPYKTEFSIRLKPGAHSTALIFHKTLFRPRPRRQAMIIQKAIMCYESRRTRWTNDSGEGCPAQKREPCVIRVLLLRGRGRTEEEQKTVKHSSTFPAQGTVTLTL